MPRLPASQKNELSKSTYDFDLFHAAFEALTTGVILMNEDCSLFHANSAAETILGMPAEELRKFEFKCCEATTFEEERTSCPWFRIFQTKQPFQDEILHVSREGHPELWLQVQASLLKEDLALIAFVDCTEQRNGEAKLASARENAVRTAQLKSEFLANMSHEVRTPMNGVIGLADLLSETTLTDEQSSMVHTIRQSTQHLLHIINDILDYSKVESGKMSLEHIECDLVQIVQETLDSQKPLANQKNLSLEFETPSNFPKYLLTDPTRIRQILLNLVNNALKFTLTGSVRVSLETVQSGQIRFVIADTGIGISKISQKSIFESFVQADGSTTRTHGGTGLGLAIVKQIVELMGGSIRLESTLEKGSTFTIDLPLETAWTLQSQLTSLPSDAPRVLLVEDTPVNRMVMLKHLEKIGICADVAENGQIAVDKYAQEPYGLILMDVQMPVMDGLEATRRIRAIETDFRSAIIAVTAHVLPEDIQRCREAGMDDHLSKPVDGKVLIQKILRWAVPSRQAEPKDFAMKQLNLDYLKEISVDDPEFEKELVQTFLDSAADLLSELESAMASSDMTTVCRASHTLKGSARSIGADYFAELSEAIENDARNERLDAAKLLANKLKDAYKALEAESKMLHAA